jgi:hypothetical protein
MQAKREFRDRDVAEVAILDALVERHDEGMTVFELRLGTDLDINRIEDALANLKSAGLITVESEPRTRIFPAPRVVPDPDDIRTEPSLVDRIREKLPL